MKQKSKAAGALQQRVKKLLLTRHLRDKCVKKGETVCSQQQEQ